jgi:hypothetical protein
MNRWPWGLLAGASAWLVGCDRAPIARMPIPPIDAATPTVIETATFALG